MTTSRLLLVALAALIAIAGALSFWVLRTGRDMPPAQPEIEFAPPQNPGQPALPTDGPIADSIERAAAYLASVPLTPDVYWLSKRTGLALGGEFEGWSEILELHDVRSNLMAFGYPPEAIDAWIGSSAMPEPLLTVRPPPANHEPRATSREFDEAALRRVIEVTIPGLQCTVACEPETVAALRESVAIPGTDYVLTHQMLSLMLAYQFDCISQEEFEPLRETLATAILQELLADTAFTDLTAERMAMLAYAGLTNWIPDSFIALAIDTQQPDGSWPVEPVFGPDSVVFSPPDHTAALALFALAHVWLVEHATQR